VPRFLPLISSIIFILVARQAVAVEVTSIRATHRSGQTFITWKDAAVGKAGAEYRYSLYRSAASSLCSGLQFFTVLTPSALNPSLACCWWEPILAFCLSSRKLGTSPRYIPVP